MSLLYGQAIRDQLERDIMQAWPDVTRVVFGKPVNNDAPRVPHVQVREPEDVQAVRHTVPMCRQNYVFMIGLTASYEGEDGRKIADIQEERINRLVSRLMSARYYSSVNARQPTITRTMKPEETTEESTYEVGIQFECWLPVAYIVNDSVLDNSTMNPSVTPLGAD